MNGASSTIQNAASHTRFRVILASRANNTPPTELEVYLRQYAEKILVKSLGSLSGAHLIIPCGDVSLPIRVYYANDIRRLEQAYPASENLLDDIENNKIQDIDNLRAFINSFSFSLVLIVLPGHLMMTQLGSSSTVTRRMMRLAQHHPNKKKAHVLVLCNTQQAVQTVLANAKTLSPDTRRRRQAFYAKETRVNFIPVEQRIQSHLAEHVSRRIAQAMGELEREHELAEYEGVLLTKVFDRLPDLLDEHKIDQAPLNKKTKALLRRLFVDAEGAPLDDDDAWMMVAQNGHGGRSFEEAVDGSRPFFIAQRGNRAESSAALAFPEEPDEPAIVETVEGMDPFMAASRTPNPAPRAVMCDTMSQYCQPWYHDEASAYRPPYAYATPHPPPRQDHFYSEPSMRQAPPYVPPPVPYSAPPPAKRVRQTDRRTDLYATLYGSARKQPFSSHYYH